MTLRLPKHVAEQLALVAQIDGQDMAEIARQALAAHVEKRTADPEFRCKARTHITDVCLLIGETGA